MRRLSTDLRSRRAAFVLTPLIDVIFLLLIFFMLSSQIAPFGLLPVTGSSEGEASPGDGAQAPAPAQRPVMLRVSRGHVSAGERTIVIGELAAALGEFKAAGITDVLLIATPSARVQDVVAVLEIFRIESFDNVTMLNRQAR